MGMNDSNSFIISGGFDSASLLTEINAAMNKAQEIVESRFAKMGASIANNIKTQISAAAGAGLADTVGKGDVSVITPKAKSDLKEQKKAQAELTTAVQGTGRAYREVGKANVESKTQAQAIAGEKEITSLLQQRPALLTTIDKAGRGIAEQDAERIRQLKQIARYSKNAAVATSTSGFSEYTRKENEIQTQAKEAQRQIDARTAALELQRRKAQEVSNVLNAPTKYGEFNKKQMEIATEAAKKYHRELINPAVGAGFAGYTKREAEISQRAVASLNTELERRARITRDTSGGFSAYAKREAEIQRLNSTTGSFAAMAQREKEILKDLENYKAASTKRSSRFSWFGARDRVTAEQQANQDVINDDKKAQANRINVFKRAYSAISAYRDLVSGSISVLNGVPAGGTRPGTSSQETRNANDIANSAKEATKANKDGAHIIDKKLVATRALAKTYADVRDQLGFINADIFTAMRRVILWGAASRLVFESIGKIGTSLKDFTTLNKILADIAKIRSPGFSTEVVGKDIIDSAKKYGIAFEEIGATQRTFFQQGYSTSQVLALTHTQLLAVTSSGLTASEAIEFLIGTMAIFDVTAERSVTILDKLQRVQAEYAIDANELAQAIRRVGPVVEELGGDLDHLIGVITALKEASRKSGEYIGTALQMIFSRMVTPLGINALAGVGVAVNKTANELRPLQDILNDVAAQWGGWNDQQRISIAMALGARHRYTQVLNLFNTYSTVMRAATDSQNAFGDALRAQLVDVKSVSRQYGIMIETIKSAGIDFVTGMLGENAADKIGNFTQRVSKLVEDLTIGKKIKLFDAEGTDALAVVLRTIGSILPKLTLSFVGLVKAIGGLSILIATTTILKSMMTRTMDLYFAMKLIITSREQLKLAFTTLAAGAKYSAAEVGAATVVMKSFTLGLSTVLGVVATFLSIIPLIKKSFDPMEKKGKALYNVFSNFSDLDPAAKKKLEEFFDVASQFRDLGGLDILEKYKKVIASMNASDLIGKPLTADMIIGDTSSIDERTKKMRDSVNELNTAIGFLRATQSGLGVEILKIKENLTAFSVAAQGFIADMNKVTGPGNDTTYGDFLEKFFGGDPDQVVSELKKVAKSAGSTFAYFGDDAPLEAQGKKLRERLFKFIDEKSSGYLHTLAQTDAGRKAAEDIVTSFQDELFRQMTITQNEATQKGAYYKFLVQLDPDVQIPEETKVRWRKTLDEAIQTTLGEAAKTKSQTEILQILTTADLQTRINVVDLFAKTDPNDPLANASRTIEDFVKVSNAALGKLEEETVTELTRNLERLRDTLDQPTVGMLYIADALSEFLVEIIDFNAEASVMEGNLTRIAHAAYLAGNTVKEAERAYLKEQITAGANLLAKFETNEALIASVQSKIRDLEAERARISLHGETDAQQSEDLEKRYSEAQKFLSRLSSDQETIAAGVAKARTQYAEYVKEYAKVVGVIRKVDLAYKQATSGAESFDKTLKAQSDHAVELTRAYTDMQRSISALTGRPVDVYKDELRGIGDTIKAKREAAEIERRGLEESTKLRIRGINARYNELDIAAQEAAILLNQNAAMHVQNEEQQKAIFQALDEYEARKAVLKTEADLLDVEESRLKVQAAINAYMEDTRVLYEYLGAQNRFSTDLAKAAGSAAAMGESFLGMKKDLLGGLVSKGLAASFKKYDIETYIRDLNAQMSTLKGTHISIPFFPSIDASGTGIFAKAIQLQLEQIQKTVDTQKGALAQLKLLPEITQKDIDAYIEVSNNLLTISSNYERVTSLVDLYKSATDDAFASAIEYYGELTDIAKEYDLILAGNRQERILDAEISAITKKLYLEQRMLTLEVQRNAEVLGILEKLEETRFEEESHHKEIINLAQAGIDLAELEGLTLEEKLQKLRLSTEAEQAALIVKSQALAIDADRDAILAAQNAKLDQAKAVMEQITALASSYASALSNLAVNTDWMTDSLSNVKFGAVFEGFGEAFASSVEARFAESLIPLFERIAAGSISLQVDELENKIKLEEQLLPYIKGSTIVYDKIKAGFDYGAGITYSALVSAQAGQPFGPQTDAPIPSGPSGAGAGDPSFIGPLVDGLDMNTAATLTELREQVKRKRVEMQLTSSIQALSLTLGTALGISAGGTQKSSALGAQIGGLGVSTIIGSLAKSINPFLGAALVGVGEIAGGLLGGLFGKKKKDPVEQQEKLQTNILATNNDALRSNTEALIKNTQSFDFLRQLLNAPSNFIVPAYATSGGGAPSISITINGNVMGNSDEFENTVYNAVSRAYSNDSRRIGRRG